MKKWTAIILILALMCSVAACGQQRNFVAGRKSTRKISNEVEIYLTEGDDPGVSISYTMHNPTDVNYSSTSAYFIERWMNGNWITTDYGSHDAHIGDPLPAGATVTGSVSFREILPPGTYRLIKTVFQDDEKDGFLIAAEFNVTDNTAASRQEDTAQEEITVYFADTDVFYSLESFLDYAATAQEGDGFSNLASLEYFYLPTGIPEGYRLYKITTGAMDMGFWYISDEDIFEGDYFGAESYRRHFKFISPRVQYDWYKGDEGMITRMADTDLLMLYLPEEYIREEELTAQERDALLKAVKFFRTEDGGFASRTGEDPRGFADREDAVFSDALEGTFLETDEHGSAFTFQFTNSTDRVYAYGKGCRFEVLRGESWGTVAYGTNITKYDVGKLYPDRSADVTYGVHREDLEPGTYRIVLEFRPVEEAEAEFVSCEFTVE